MIFCCTKNQLSLLSVGSGIGQTLWIVMASDLRCISDMNLLVKYADDTNLLMPENTNMYLFFIFFILYTEMSSLICFCIVNKHIYVYYVFNKNYLSVGGAK